MFLNVSYLKLDTYQTDTELRRLKIAGKGKYYTKK